MKDVLRPTEVNVGEVKKWESADIMLRAKRQITLPKELCEELGIKPGDVLEATVEGSTLTVRPKKVAALKALEEIQYAFEQSGVTEYELKAAGKRIRHEVVRENYRDIV